MTPYEKLYLHVHALNRDGLHVEMKIILRAGRLFLWNGLSQHELASLPGKYSAVEVATEVQNLTGATRVVITSA